jgi:hypothetical protein
LLSRTAAGVVTWDLKSEMPSMTRATSPAGRPAEPTDPPPWCELGSDLALETEPALPDPDPVGDRSCPGVHDLPPSPGSRTWPPG